MACQDLFNVVIENWEFHGGLKYGKIIKFVFLAEIIFFYYARYKFQRILFSIIFSIFSKIKIYIIDELYKICWLKTM